MNAAYLLLDERTTSAFDSVAQDLVSKSAFERVTGPVYLVVLGVTRARAQSTNASAVHGRCVKWEVTKNALRVVVSFAPDAEIELAKLGRAEHAITLGSIAKIDPEQHANFLAAVEQAYPLTGDSTFACSQIGGVHVAEPAATAGSTGKTGRAKADATAATAMDVSGSGISKSRRRNKKKPNKNKSPMMNVGVVAPPPKAKPAPRWSKGPWRPQKPPSRNMTWVRPQQQQAGPSGNRIVEVRR